MSEARGAWLDLVLAGLAGFFALHLAAVALLYWRVAGGQLGFLGALSSMGRPLLLLGATALLLVTRAALRRRDGRLLDAGTLVVTGLVLTAYVYRSWVPSYLPLRALLPVLAALTVAVRLQGVVSARLPLMSLSAFAGAAFVLALHPFHYHGKANRFGLLVTEIGRVVTQEYGGQALKSGWPACRFEYNSLGYRDVEPSFPPKETRRRVLLVGDSCVWGDGIPSNEETLGSRLREELERLSPGRFAVMSAAYPGLGIYGYSRYIDENARRFLPDVVVLSFHGKYENDLFDPQLLLDSLPERPWLANLLGSLGTAQQLHEVSKSPLPNCSRSAACAARFASMLDGMPRTARERGYRLLFLVPDPVETALPAGLESLELPPELRFQGREDKFWYAGDPHPKPKLNGVIARLLALRIMRAGRAPRRA